MKNFSAQSWPDENRNFSRRWVEPPQRQKQPPAVRTEDEILETNLRRVVMDWQKGRKALEAPVAFWQGPDMERARDSTTAPTPGFEKSKLPKLQRQFGPFSNSDQPLNFGKA